MYTENNNFIIINIKFKQSKHTSTPIAQISQWRIVNQYCREELIIYLLESKYLPILLEPFLRQISEKHQKIKEEGQISKKGMNNIRRKMLSTNDHLLIYRSFRIGLKGKKRNFLKFVF